jgi:hypothetical protein
MKKLVVCYTDSDECTYACEVVLCFEYSSTEAFLVNFEIALKNAIECSEKFDKNRKIRSELFNRKIRSELFSENFRHEQKYIDNNKEIKINKNIETKLKELDSWEKSFLEEHPGTNNGKFMFAGYEFYISAFLHWAEIKKNRYIALPDVYELDEWFSMRKITGEES